MLLISSRSASPAVIFFHVKLPNVPNCSRCSPAPLGVSGACPAQPRCPRAQPWQGHSPGRSLVLLFVFARQVGRTLPAPLAERQNLGMSIFSLLSLPKDANPAQALDTASSPSCGIFFPSKATVSTFYLNFYSNKKARKGIF